MGKELFDDVKPNPSAFGTLKYKLQKTNVYVTKSGFHFIDYLDPVSEIDPVIDQTQLTDSIVSYIEKQLQSNLERFENQKKSVEKHTTLKDAKLLDIGCGGGLFLSLAKNSGADTIGIELSDSRAYYAQKKHQLTIEKRLIESDFWQHNYKNHFDIVTMWDVIEHVNYPFQTLQASANVLKKGGFFFIDTPCRDGFYHRVGELTYKLSNGKFPTFLNTMYSPHMFGHKQIFSTKEMKRLFESVGLEVVESVKFHELSFPYEFYIRRSVKSNFMVKLLLPFVKLFFKVFKIRNKMLVVGRKK